jgi:hypothetical protein
MSPTGFNPVLLTSSLFAMSEKKDNPFIKGEQVRLAKESGILEMRAHPCSFLVDMHDNNLNMRLLSLHEPVHGSRSSHQIRLQGFLAICVAK